MDYYAMLMDINKLTVFKNYREPLVAELMLDSEQKTTTSDSSLAEDLLQLSNEFNAFNDFYACLCDTLADVVVEDQVLDAGTVEGISRCSRWMKYRMDEIRAKLEAIQKKSCKKTVSDPGSR